MTVTEHELEHGVERELGWSSDINHDRIGVTVTAGTVMLSREVLSYPEKAAAVTAALRVRGVTALAEEIIVRHTHGRTQDTDIAQRAANALRNTTLLPTDSIQATVHDHTVTLVGALGWHHQRTAAAHAIKPHEAMVAGPDAEANVTAALLRNAQLEAEHVHVTVCGTEIRLTGQVATWTARHQAEYAAWCTPGVTHVDDRLVITPPVSDDLPYEMQAG